MGWAEMRGRNDYAFFPTLPKTHSAIYSAFLFPLDFVFDFRYLPHIETEFRGYPFEANGTMSAHSMLGNGS